MGDRGPGARPKPFLRPNQTVIRRNYVPSLSDEQLAILTEAARGLAPEKRGVFLQRTFSILRRQLEVDDDTVAAV